MTTKTKVAAEVVVSERTLAAVEEHRSILASIEEGARRRAEVEARVAAYPDPVRRPTRRERRLAARRGPRS